MKKLSSSEMNHWIRETNVNNRSRELIAGMKVSDCKDHIGTVSRIDPKAGATGLVEVDCDGFKRSYVFNGWNDFLRILS